ncbi:hypothetical protein LZ578_11000 [Jeotgalibaca sp. MA1X17-3]|uniref:hypothetical protein n=1 Tax=Jeotgalibaca sp. MA1X17-3 TaxID=2908211 RepID=UPI001F3E7BD7|nr:hypothetical protein [Jeotgalibaca sp. MA1X17-3]UJF15480.1 hypothetical protein LZ578_11000 [Jeotgalibaca sp. MA1X17-3]
MSRTLFLQTWLQIFRSTKNRLAIVLAFLAIIFYSAFFLPQINTNQTINLEQLQMELLSNKGIMEDAIENGNFHINQFTGQSTYEESKYHYEQQRALYSSITSGDAERYTKIFQFYVPPFHLEMLNEYYLENSVYPGKDLAHDWGNYRIRMDSYKENESPITFSVIQQKTSWQQIQLFFLNFGSTLFVIFTLFVASDVFLQSRKSRTQQIGVPIAWNRHLFIQSLAILSYVAICFLSLAVLFYFLNGFLNGFGSLTWKTSLFVYNENFVTDPDTYPMISIGLFLLKILPFLLMITYLFVRLSVLFSLLFRQEVMVFLAGLFLLLFEQLYFSRTTRKILGIPIGYFPQTYFDYGKVITGEKNYLMNTGSITYDRGLFVLIVSTIVLEGILAFTTHWRTRQKFIQ